MPKNALIMFTGKELARDGNLKEIEPWYGTKYGKVDVVSGPLASDTSSGCAQGDGPTQRALRVILTSGGKNCLPIVSRQFFRDRKGTPNNLCDKDFAELSGELSGSICLKPLSYFSG